MAYEEKLKDGPQCCAVDEGARCLSNASRGWHLCAKHLERGGRSDFVQEAADQSPIECHQAVVTGFSDGDDKEPT